MSFFTAEFLEHTLCDGIVGLFNRPLFQIPRAPLPLMMTVVLLGSLLEDSILFGIYSVFNLNQEPYSWAILNHMLPTMLFHFAIGLLFYIPVRRQLELIKKETNKEEAA